jgi:hypothetical protein
MQLSNVTIDDKFARFGAKSYAINKINSVEVRDRKPHGQGAVFLAGLLAIIFALAALGSLASPDGASWVSVGLAALCGWLAYKAWLRSKIVEYQLFLMTSSSEAQAFVTHDQDEVLDLRNRIESAMAAS